MSAFKSVQVAVALATVLCIPLADAQSLVPGVAPSVRMRPVPQPDIDDYLSKDSDHDAVILMLVKVDADGVVREATLIEGFFTPEQAEGARRFAMKLSFDVTGVDTATQLINGYIPIIWTRSDTVPQMSPALTASLQEAVGLIGRKEWSGALAKLDAIQAGEARVTRDYLFLEYLRAVAFSGWGNPHEALRHARTATWRGMMLGASVRGYLQPNKDLVAQALEARASIEKSLGMFTEALDTLSELQELRERQKVPISASLKDSMESLRKLIAGDADLATSMRIDRVGLTAARLVRPVFSVSGLAAGRVKQAWVRCKPAEGTSARREVTYEVPLNRQSWNRPDTPDDCRVEFRGQEGATIRLTQSRR